MSWTGAVARRPPDGLSLAAGAGSLRLTLLVGSRLRVIFPSGKVNQLTGASATVILTIGHSTRPLAEFVRLLQAHGVKCLVDVRTVPRSRHNPQFNRESLPASLRASGIDYIHLAELGGLRRPGPDSLNAAWRNASFRGYADHMQTPQFAEGLRKLFAIAEEQPVAVMCAEAVQWRCHRSLLADALLARGIAVEEIVSETRRQPHRMTEWAKVDGTRVTYPLPLLQ